MPEPALEAKPINVKIKRFNPEKDKRPYWAEYKLEARGTDRVLDVLHQIKWETDGTLSFRRSCAHGICGSDAMLINGVNRLACKILVRELGSTITVEPIRGLTVIKDMIVDMEPFFDSYKAVLPYFINDEPTPTGERLQSPEDREIFDATTKCILCAACTTSCPVFWTNGSYFGTGGDCQRAPLYLRFARRGYTRPDAGLRSVERALALPHRVQLHRGVSARNSGNAGYRRR